MRRTLLLLLFLLAGPAAHGQFFYFGRNKVQYTAFDWHILKTPHFDIYYYPQMQDLAGRGAAFAEEAYADLQVRFRHSPGMRIPLIFYSSHLHFQQTNTIGGFIPEGVGGFFEFLKGRVVIPSDGSLPQFRHVIRHELVHVFMHSKATRVLADHRKTADRMPPLWFTEGLAEYWSTEWDTQAEMVLRDAVLTDYIRGLEDIESLYGSYLLYKAGQDILRHVAKVYGEEKILLLLENFWKKSSFEEVFRLTLGKDYEEFDEEWLYALKKRCYPLLAASDMPGSVTVEVAKEGFSAKPVVFETDTTREVYFIGNRTGYTGVYRKNILHPDPDAPAVNVVQGERSDELEAFHPFRTRMDVSPQGVLAFVTKSGETDVLHLYDIAGESISRTFRFPSLVSIGSTSWAPGGRRLAFTAISESGNNDLYLLDTQTGALTRLTNDYYDDRDPAWSPRGDVIAFSSDRGAAGREGRYGMFLYHTETDDITYLVAGDFSAGAPAWSRDGRLLAFTADPDGAQNIWLTEPGGAEKVMRKATRFVTAAFDPAWTRTGDLVFASFEKFSFQIRMLNGVAAGADTLSATLPALPLHRDEPWRAASAPGASEAQPLRYKEEYSLDFAQSAISTDPVFGTAGGAFLALSDLLGNDQYYFLLYNTAQSQDELLSSFNVAISRVSLARRTNHAYGIYRFSGRRYDLGDRDEFFFERVFGGYLALSYPLTRFQRVEANVSLSNSTRDVAWRAEERKALLLSNSLSYTHDNSLWGPSGPLDGSRFNVTLAYTSDIQHSNVNYYTLILDYRHYFRLAQTIALGSRAWLFYNHGKESRRFVMGGSWDLRGWPRWSLRGEKLWLASQELRFPLLDELGLGFPFGRIGFRRIRGALFFDAGNAWDLSYGGTLGSVGGGIRLNLAGILVLRYDTGKRIEDNFTRLQEGLFHQVFFGWDF
ncbi:MAG: BamA/TamA family outer membrane protein [Bacteroidota bacterium]